VLARNRRYRRPIDTAFRHDRLLLRTRPTTARIGHDHEGLPLRTISRHRHRIGPGTSKTITLGTSTPTSRRCSPDAYVDGKRHQLAAFATKAEARGLRSGRNGAPWQVRSLQAARRAEGPRVVRRSYAPTASRFDAGGRGGEPACGGSRAAFRKLGSICGLMRRSCGERVKWMISTDDGYV
jgi:hypothetical protein